MDINLDGLKMSDAEKLKRDFAKAAYLLEKRKDELENAAIEYTKAHKEYQDLALKIVESEEI